MPPENNPLRRIACAADQSIPNLALFILGLAVTLGMLRGGAVAAIGIVGSLLLYAAATIAARRPPPLDRTIAAFILALLVCVTVLDLQAAYPALSWHETGQLATILLPLTLLSAPALQARIAASRWLLYWPRLLIFGALLLAALLLDLYLQPSLDEYRLTKYSRGLSYAFLLSWPAMALLWRHQRRLEAALVLLALLPALYLTHSRATQLAAAIAIVVFAIAWFAPKLTRYALALLFAATLGWPFYAQTIFTLHPGWVAHLPDSWRARMEIWDFMSYRLLERPWLGWGLGASHNLSPALPHGQLYKFTTGPVGHPHDAVIEFWVELGLPGLAILIAFAFCLLWRAGRAQRQLAPFFLAAWTVALILSLVAYDFWTDSLLAALALTAFAAALTALPKNSNGTYSSKISP